MKKSVFLLSTLLICTAAAGGWRDVLASKLLGPLQTPPKVEETRDKGQMVIKITNISNTAIGYAGYGESSPQQFTEELVDGRWVPSGWDWCGTGIEFYTIQPQSSMEFRYEATDEFTKKRVYMIVSGVGGSSLVLLRGPKE